MEPAAFWNRREREGTNERFFFYNEGNGISTILFFIQPSGKKIKTERQTDRQTETERDRDRETERDRDRETETETEL